MQLYLFIIIKSFLVKYYKSSSNHYKKYFGITRNHIVFTRKDSVKTTKSLLRKNTRYPCGNNLDIRRNVFEFRMILLSQIKISLIRLRHFCRNYENKKRVINLVMAYSC